ncbi:hypothetical protein, partial [Maribacter luteus]|uniref:hypothetical protein n=1 Tax=Maribacter luteus TaxID=2594478 RepID=UPI0024927244
DEMLIEDARRRYGIKFSQLEFDVEYVPSTENSFESLYLEERQVKIDKTETKIEIPKILFNKD